MTTTQDLERMTSKAEIDAVIALAEYNIYRIYLDFGQTAYTNGGVGTEMLEEMIEKVNREQSVISKALERLKLIHL